MRYLKVSNDMIESKLIAKNCNKNHPRENTWPNHVKNEQHIRSKKTYGPKKHTKHNDTTDRKWKCCTPVLKSPSRKLCPFWLGSSIDLVNDVQNKTQVQAFKPQDHWGEISFKVILLIARGWGCVLPTMAYTGRLCPNGVPFSGFRYIEG